MQKQIEDLSFSSRRVHNTEAKLKSISLVQLISQLPFFKYT
ncbi:unnamed protein product [Paramecium octaurelia]|uniref:Uncharacterized protein n=1 Tax=Paramecium octaurelia TaxID=43137 RepID=A0A8S1UW82_PAROT|nr:unnamed protein product [Paramecium octaurelia]